MVSMGSQRGGVEGSRVSLLRCLGRFRGQKGVLVGSYHRCLERVGGQKGVPLGSYLRCLGRVRGSTFIVLAGTFSCFKGRTRLEGLGGF